ncbi:unnamed protein product, partial [Didymodactylos carnosus]
MRPLNASLAQCKAILKQNFSLKNICAQSYDQCAELSKKIEHLSEKINNKISSLGRSNANASLRRVIECIENNDLALIEYSPVKADKGLKKRIAKVDINLSEEMPALSPLGKQRSQPIVPLQQSCPLKKAYLYVDDIECEDCFKLIQ